MTKTKVQPRRGRGKADAQAEADELTAGRIRAILSDEETPESVKQELRGLVSGFGDWTRQSYDPVEVFTASARTAPFGDKSHREGIRDARATVVAFTEQHEPKDARLARHIIAACYPTEEARQDAARGVCVDGSALDHLTDIAHELKIFITHPVVLPAALPFILRQVRAIKAERPGKTYRGQVRGRVLDHFREVIKQAGK